MNVQSAAVPAPRGAAELRPRAAQRWIRIAFCVLLLGSGGAVFLQRAYAMATTSLWTDELYTILHYSGRGPLVTVTEYHEPNNHVFFNLVNAITPGRTSVQPLRARLWSFAATFATLALAFLWFARRGAAEWGALLFCVLAIQPELMDLSLQTRGYGFLCLFALVSCFLAERVAEQATARRLAGMGLVSVLGAWTVPTFAFFSASLWALLLLLRPRRAVLAAGVVSAVAIAAVYAPIARPLWDQATRYGSEWGHEYGGIRAVGETIAIYLLMPLAHGAGMKPAVAGLVISSAALLALAWRRDRRHALLPLLALGSVAGFLAACLLLRTPLIRTTAFVAVPLAFAVVLLLRSAAGAVPARTRTALLAAAGLALSARAATLAARFHYVPHESWKELAETLTNTLPPGSARFYVDALPEFLDGYLPRDYRPAPVFDPRAFDRGTMIVLDTPVMGPREGRFDGRKLSRSAVEYRIAQRRAGYEAIWLTPPEQSFVAGATPALVDRDTSSGTAGGLDSLDVTLRPGRRYRSAVIVTDGDRPFTVRATAGGTSRSIDDVRSSGRVTLVPLGDEPVSSLALRPPPGARGLPPVREIWAYAVE